MVYYLHKFRNYLLGGPFKLFTNHFSLKYFFNKPILEGRICRWILLFQEFSFKVFSKLGLSNVGLDHPSHLESSETRGSVDDKFLDADLFTIKVVPNYTVDITLFLATRKCLNEYITTQRKHMVIRVANY